MADEKILEVIKKLAKRTSAGRVPWQQAVDEGVFQAAFKDYAVRLSQAPSRNNDAPFDYVFQIYNGDGELVEEVRDIDYDDPEGQDTPTFGLMHGLYKDARRIAMGVDRAVRSLLSELTD